MNKPITIYGWASEIEATPISDEVRKELEETIKRYKLYGEVIMRRQFDFN